MVHSSAQPLPTSPHPAFREMTREQMGWGCGYRCWPHSWPCWQP